MPGDEKIHPDAEGPDLGVSIQAQLLSHATEGLALVDPVAGVTVAANPAFRRLCGLEKGEEIYFADLFADPCARSRFRQLAASGPGTALRPARLYLRLPGGELRLAEVRIAWVAGPQGSLVAVALRDLVTEERLAGLAAQGRRLWNLTRLTSSLVHRFNNLLGVVTGYAGQLQGVVAEGREEQALRQILAAGQEAARLGAGIARVVGGLQSSAPSPVDLQAELFVLRDILEKLAQKRRIEWSLEAPAALQTFGRAELLRDLLLEVTMQRFLACADQGRFSIRLEKEAGLFGHRGRPGTGWLRITWEGVPLAPAPAPSPMRTPPEWPAFLAQVLGGELEESGETGRVSLHLPRYGREKGRAR